MKKLLLLLITPLLFNCSNKEIKAEQGSLNIVSNVYFNASKGLENMKQFHISKMSWKGEDLIEFVPNIEFPEFYDTVYYIKDSSYYGAGNHTEAKGMIFSEIIKNKPNSIYKKSKGAVFVNIPIFDYELRKNLSDTVLYGNKEFKRFEINTKDAYSVFYLTKTDTILPYSFNRTAERDYKGRLERIDSYDKKKDLFSTIVLISSNKIDNDALDIFKYNEEIKQLIKK